MNGPAGWETAEGPVLHVFGAVTGETRIVALCGTTIKHPGQEWSPSAPTACPHCVRGWLLGWDRAATTAAAKARAAA